MKPNCFCLIVLCAVAISAPFLCGVAAALPPEPSPEVKAFLQHHRDRCVKGMREGNPSLMNAIAPDTSRLMTEAQPTVFGPDNIAAYHRAFFAKFAVREYSREATGLFDLGTRVVETGRFAEKLALKSNDATFDLTGKYLELWEKLPDGQLRQVLAATNFDAPFPHLDLLRFPEVASTPTAFLPRALITTDTAMEIAGLSRLLEQAVVEHDAALWKRLYSADAVLLANNSPACVARPAIEEYVDAHCRELPIFQKLDIRNDRIEELDGYVFEYASHVASWRNGDSSGVSTGKNLRIWRRESNHALKMIFQIGSYD